MVSRFLCGRDRQSFEDFSLTFAGRKCILKANRIKSRRFSDVFLCRNTADLKKCALVNCWKGAAYEIPDRIQAAGPEIHDSLPRKFVKCCRRKTACIMDSREMRRSKKAEHAGLVFAGFWADRGSCDAGMADFLQKCGPKYFFPVWGLPGLAVRMRIMGRYWGMCGRT